MAYIAEEAGRLATNVISLCVRVQVWVSQAWVPAYKINAGLNRGDWSEHAKNGRSRSRIRKQVSL